jgi:hypothetical protein
MQPPILATEPARVRVLPALQRSILAATFFKMKLQQGHIWKAGDRFFRIVHLERLEVKFKEMADPSTAEGTHHHVTKKEFCRLIKGGELQKKIMTYGKPEKESDSYNEGKSN